MFIPFISDVRVKSDGGISTGGPQSFDGDDSSRICSSTVVSSSSTVIIGTPNALNVSSSIGVDPRDPKIQDIQDKPRDRLTPPSSPHVGSGSISIGGSTTSPSISISKDR